METVNINGQEVEVKVYSKQKQAELRGIPVSQSSVFATFLRSNRETWGDWDLLFNMTNKVQK